MIDKERRYWIKEVMDNIILPHEASLIKSIHISHGDCNDKLIWPFNLDGEYSVRSSYRLMLEEEMNAIPSSSDLSQPNKTCKGLWSMTVPNRIKI